MKLVLLAIAATLAHFVTISPAAACICGEVTYGPPREAVAPTVLPTASLWLQVDAPGGDTTLELRLVESQRKTPIRATITKSVRSDRITAQVSPSRPLPPGISIDLEVRYVTPGLPVPPWNLGRRYIVGSSLEASLFSWPSLHVASERRQDMDLLPKHASTRCFSHTFNSCGELGPSLVLEAVAPHAASSTRVRNLERIS